MKYLFLLGALAAGYYLLARDTPVAAVTETFAQTESTPAGAGPAPQTTPLKRPLDRTNAALDLVKQRNEAGEF